MNKQPKKGYGFIYKYTSPSGKSYIGQTTQSLEKRAGHKGKYYLGCHLFYKAIQKYGFENFEVEVLAEVKKEKLDEKEKYFIQAFNTLSPNGYNMTEGGQGFSRKEKSVFQYSLSSGELLKEWENTKEIVSFFNFSSASLLEGCLIGRVYSCYGYCWSYLKMKKYPIHERIVNPIDKKVKQFSLSGILIKEYSSISEAARQTGCERSAIKRCCRGELLSHGGFKWECSEVVVEKKYNNSAKKIKQIDPITNEVIQVFPSISKAAQSLEKGTGLIRDALKRGVKAYGYKWELA